MTTAETMYASAIDPITLEIIRNRWQSVADEMCAALVLASDRPTLSRRDCSAAIALPNGEVLAGGSRHAAAFGHHAGGYPLRPLNSSHRPISAGRYGHYQSALSGVLWPFARFIDGFGDLRRERTADRDRSYDSPPRRHGGYAPGSMPLGVTEIYQEGLHSHPRHAARPDDEPLLKLINQNVRTKLAARRPDGPVRCCQSCRSRFIDTHQSRRADPLHARRARLCGSPDQPESGCLMATFPLRIFSTMMELAPSRFESLSLYGCEMINLSLISPALHHKCSVR